MEIGEVCARLSSYVCNDTLADLLGIELRPVKLNELHGTDEYMCEVPLEIKPIILDNLELVNLTGKMLQLDRKLFLEDKLKNHRWIPFWDCEVRHSFDEVTGNYHFIWYTKENFNES
jgi:hypothetical protein